jgi:copper chaperone CopZ
MSTTALPTQVALDTLGGYMSDSAAQDVVYVVPDMSCEHCKHAIASELASVAGVTLVDVDLESKVVTVRGTGLDDAALRAAIEEAGYEAE